MDGGRDEVDVVAAQVLQLEHRPRQLLVGHRPAPAGLRYLPVLAVDAGQVAGREEDGARPARAHQRRLLAEVGAEGRYHRPRADAAEAPLVVGAAVHLAARAGRPDRGWPSAPRPRRCDGAAPAARACRYDGLCTAALLIALSIAIAALAEHRSLLAAHGELVEPWHPAHPSTGSG